MAEVSNSYAVKKPYLTASFPPITSQIRDFKSRLCDIQGNAAMVAVQSNVILQNSAGRSSLSVSARPWSGPRSGAERIGKYPALPETPECAKLAGRPAPIWEMSRADARRQLR
jgi:hypothetical protein